jgi:hypothetical protein
VQAIAAHRQQQAQLQQQASGTRSGRDSAEPGYGGGGDAEREAWAAERRAMQQEVARLKSELSAERLVKNDVYERLLRLEQQYMAMSQGRES